MFAVTRLTLLCAVLAGSVIASADEVVLSDDGEQILLKADGTWVKLSQDRYARDQQGRRLRLWPDGTWSVLVPSAQPEPESTPAQVPAVVATSDEPTLLLRDVAILKRVIKRPKADHAETRMRFEVVVQNTSNNSFELSRDLPQTLSV